EQCGNQSSRLGTSRVQQLHREPRAPSRPELRARTCLDPPTSARDSLHIELDVPLAEQLAGRACERGRGLRVAEHRCELGELRGRELLLALRDEEVRRRAIEELALLDLEALLGELAEVSGGLDL